MVLTVKKVVADEKNKRQFENLGIIAGASLTVLSQVGGGVIVKVRASRLALDRGLAMKISYKTGNKTYLKGIIMEKKLNEFKPGERGVVLRIDGEGKIRRRLFDMGVTPGAEIVLRKLAPLGDPVEVTLRGYELTLRKAEASCVMMEVKHA